ncbi:metallophosphoesterase, partial [Myxococcota bacterium]|nr:metallophosphoesterase [Myxococcota bacterium]
MNKTKRVTLALLSDTHGLHDTIQVPDADILVHAGDMTNRGSLDDLNRFASWLKELPHEHKIIVAGNHDWCFENNHAESKQIIEKTGAIYLQDEAVEVEGLNIYGSPWQPWFYDWAFNLPRDGDELKAKWAAIPNDTHILLTHS